MVPWYWYKVKGRGPGRRQKRFLFITFYAIPFLHDSFFTGYFGENSEQFKTSLGGVVCTIQHEIIAQSRPTVPGVVLFTVVKVAFSASRT